MFQMVATFLDQVLKCDTKA